MTRQSDRIVLGAAALRRLAADVEAGRVEIIDLNRSALLVVNSAAIGRGVPVQRITIDFRPTRRELTQEDFVAWLERIA